MKKILIIFAIVLVLLPSCATIFGGKITTCQTTKPAPDQPSRKIRTVPFILDCFTTLFIGLIVDFSTCAIYEPCKENTDVQIADKNVQTENKKDNTQPVIHVNVKDSALIGNQKQVNIVYMENNNQISNKQIFLAYYDEINLKRIICSTKADSNGVATFFIPSTAHSGSVPFYFSYNNDDFNKNKFAFRIVPKDIYEKAGEKMITLIVDKKYKVIIKDASVQLIKFPNDGNKIGNGGDILTGGSIYLR